MKGAKLICLISGTSVIAISIIVIVWYALVLDSSSGKVIPSSEWRIILATSIAAVVSLVSMITGLAIQTKNMRLDSLKKSLEISTEAAFDMWMSCTTAYRLLAKADSNGFEKGDLSILSEAFEHSEKKTLLLEEETLREYQLLWQEAERIGSELANSDVPPLSVAGLFRVRGYYSRTSARCFA